MPVACYQKHVMYKHSDLFNLNGSSTLITGGTGAIGYDIAKKFAELGQQVFILGRNQEKLSTIKNEIKDINT